MLGVNVLNYIKYAATVKDVEPLVIRLPKRPDIPEDLAEARFVSEAGYLVDVFIDLIVACKEHLELHCSIKNAKTRGLAKNSRMLFYAGHGAHPPDPTHRIIDELYRGIKQIGNRPLCDLLYGDAESFSWSKMDTTILR